ncbi:MAG: hypothetical protein ABJG78_13990 [Cyclobacteriaceae bacterium]
MKHFTALVLIIIVFASFGQEKRRTRKVMWDDWYDSAAYARGPQPLIKGVGLLSNSYSIKNDGITVYECQGKYYLINNLADYYFWFTRKYEFLFRKEISIYKELYYAGESYKLAQYVYRNYKGKKLPIKFRFPHNQRVPYSDPPLAPDVGRPQTIQKFKNGKRIGQ